MSTTEKVVIALVFFVLIIVGLSGLLVQGYSQPIFLGVFPAPVFYLMIVHILIALALGYMAFFTRFHGRCENEEEFLAEVRAERAAKEGAR